MHLIKNLVFIVICSLALSGCSVFGDVSVDIIPYETIEKNGSFEVRKYERLVFASTRMPGGLDSSYSLFVNFLTIFQGITKKLKKLQ